MEAIKMANLNCCVNERNFGTILTIISKHQ